MGSRWVKISLGICLAVLASTVGAARADAHPDWLFTSWDIDAYGRCLDRDVATNRLQMWECHDGDNQDWGYRWPNSNENWVVIDDPSNTWCVKASSGQGVQLTAANCQYDLPNSVRWIPHYRSNGWFVFESVTKPGQCMDIRDWGAGRVVQLWACHFGDNQQWTTWRTGW